MNLITDRTMDDVLLGTPKGKYGASDLNRVEMAVAELYEAAKALGIEPPGAIKTDWAFTSVFSADTWPTRGQMERYLQNIIHLCKAVELAAGLLVNRSFRVWDYRQMPMNFLGQICLPFSLLWIPVSFGAMLLYRYLERHFQR